MKNIRIFAVLLLVFVLVLASCEQTNTNNSSNSDITSEVESNETAESNVDEISEY